MTISDSTLSTSVWSDVRSKLIAATLQTTNSNDASTRSASVNASYNDKSATRPQVIIVPPMTDEGEFKFGGTEGKKAITVVIEIYDQTTEYVDQLADQVRVALKANDISGIDLMSISEDYAFSSPGGNKYHLKTLSCSYLRE